MLHFLEFIFAHYSTVAHAQAAQAAQAASSVIEQSDWVLFQIIFPPEVMTLLAQLFKLMDTQVLWLFWWLCWSCKRRKMLFVSPKLPSSSIEAIPWEILHSLITLIVTHSVCSERYYYVNNWKFYRTKDSWRKLLLNLQISKHTLRPLERGTNSGSSSMPTATMPLTMESAFSFLSFNWWQQWQGISIMILTSQ